MGRILSPIHKQELENLDKDPDSHESAMKFLKSHVKNVDEKAIPLFLARVSESIETGCEPVEYTVSLFEELARVHGVKIAPHTETIMVAIMRTMAHCAGSFSLQEACSKVVSAIARYGIDPGTPGDKRKNVIHSLCKVLSDSLVVSQEHLALGAAICLKALVECDNWRFASDEMVNMVCQNVAVALDVCSSKTDSYIELVIALAKHNPFIVEAYARLLVHSGLRILTMGVMEGNTQKKLLAIQMLKFLMMNLDPKSMYSELDLIVHELEKCQNDSMHFVKMAACETIQIARKMGEETDSKFDGNCDSVTGSNFSRGSHNSGITASVVGQPIMHMPSKFEDFHSFTMYDSSNLRAHASVELGNDDHWSVNYKHESYVNRQADDELFSSVVNGSTTPCSPRRSQSCVNDFDILSHPRNMNSEFKQPGNQGTTCLPSFTGNTKLYLPEAPPRHHCPFDELQEDNMKRISIGGEQYEGPAASISSTIDVLSTTSTDIPFNSQPKPPMRKIDTPLQKGWGMSGLRLGLSFISIVVLGFASFMWTYVQDDTVPHLVPT